MKHHTSFVYSFAATAFVTLCASLAIVSPAFAQEQICKEFNSSGTVRMGMKNNSLVAELQKELNIIQGEKLKADGNFGAGTRAAVQRFQKKLNQKADGVAGPATFAAIRAYYQENCTPSDSTTEKTYTNQLKKFSNTNEFQKFITSQSKTTINRFDVMPVTVSANEGSVMAVTTTATATSASGSSSVPNFSQTNTQEAAVDESDIIKTDGLYIYTLSGSAITITKTDKSGKLEVVSRINMREAEDNVWASDMYLQGNTLVLVGSRTVTRSMPLPRVPDGVVVSPEFVRFAPQSIRSYTYTRFYDITDKTKPQLTKEYLFTGSNLQSRIVDGQFYLVTKGNARYATEGIIDMPEVISGGVTTKVAASSVYYFDMPYQTYEFTQIHAITVNKPATIATTTYLLSGGNSLYVSENALYLSYTEYGNGRMTIMPVINSVPTDPNANAITTAALIPERREPTEKTIIHKFALSKKGVTLSATGSVPGRAINQFAFSEYAGNLRVATTQGNTWSGPESSNAVYVLDGKLDRIGTLENLAKGEEIYSVRFVDDKVYLVTFEQIDPLFVISLKNPRSPMVLGELKIPGFSTYLHPYDSTTILGIGRDTEMVDGRVHQKGVKIALFDVSNVNRPRVIDSMVLGGIYAYSPALYDHKAVLFSKEKNLLVIPFINNDTTTSNAVSFNGAAVLSVTKERGIKQKGKITHDSGDNIGNAISRTLYIGDTLYSMSYNYLESNNLTNLKTIAQVGIGE